MRPLDGFPTSWGSNRAAVIPHRGPSTYTQVTPGVAPALSTGGDLVQAVEAGMKLIDFVVGGLTDSGTYRVECLPTTVSGLVGDAVQAPAQVLTTYRLRWVVVATGAEVAGQFELNDEIVRLLVIGPK